MANYLTGETIVVFIAKSQLLWFDTTGLYRITMIEVFWAWEITCNISQESRIGYISNPHSEYYRKVAK